MTEVFLSLSEDFQTQTEVFSSFFRSCKANARVKLAFLEGARSALFHILFFSICIVLCTFICVVQCISCDCDNPIAVNKYNII
jgi:hypothetical protein